MTYWSPERVERLHELLLTGDHSGGSIATILSGESPFERISRCAVIGKVHRMKWTHLLHPSSPAQQAPHKPGRKRATRPRMLRPPPPLAPAPEQPITNGHRVDLQQLTATSCRWPIGDPRAPGFGFCGRPAQADRPYCHAHLHKARAR